MKSVRMYKALVVGMFCLANVTLGKAVADSHTLTVSMLIPGDIDDGGFMEAGYEGLVAISDTLGAETSYIANTVPSDVYTLAGALRRLAEKGPDLIIAHGVQTSYAAMRVAAEYPDIHFAVTQGHVTASNLSSYWVTDVSAAVMSAACDVINGSWAGNQIVHTGWDDVSPVELMLEQGTELPMSIRAELKGLNDAIDEGKIEVSVIDVAEIPQTVPVE